MAHNFSQHRIVAALIISLACSGCLEIKTTTRVGADGSVRRIQESNEGNVDSLHGVFPSEVDSTWTVVKGDSNGVKAVRVFSSPEEFNQALDDTLNPRTICVHSSLEKHFRGFFVEMTYRETVRGYAPFGGPPLDDFVSADEIRDIRECRADRNSPVSHDDSVAAKALEQKFLTWMETRNRRVFDAYCAELKEGVRRLHDPSLHPEDVTSRADAVYEKCQDMTYSSGNLWRVDSTFQVVLKNPKVKDAIALNPEGFSAIREKLDVLDQLVYRWDVSAIEMPGIITATNAGTIEGNKAIWKDIGFAVSVSGADLWVSSQMLNWWAVGGAGFLVILAVALSIFAWVRRRRSGF